MKWWNKSVKKKTFGDSLPSSDRLPFDQGQCDNNRLAWGRKSTNPYHVMRETWFKISSAADGRPCRCPFPFDRSPTKPETTKTLSTYNTDDVATFFFNTCTLPSGLATSLSGCVTNVWWVSFLFQLLVWKSAKKIRQKFLDLLNSFPIQPIKSSLGWPRRRQTNRCHCLFPTPPTVPLSFPVSKRAPVMITEFMLRHEGPIFWR